MAASERLAGVIAASNEMASKFQRMAPEERALALSMAMNLILRVCEEEARGKQNDPSRQSD